jgi:hypothetical protein
MRPFPAPRLLLSAVLLTLCAAARAQTPPAPAPATPAPAAQTPPDTPLPQSKPLSTRPVPTPEQTAADQAEALRISKLAIINGRPYDQPSTKDTVIDYAKDSYLLPALAGATVRTLYSFSRDKPTEWGQDFPGFMQRFGVNYLTIAINGNVRLAMELTFHEDLRYIPCHGCKVKAKIENALLAEITARHDVDGHRFFTLTPTIADFSGPIITHTFAYPAGFDPMAGVISTRLVFATRIGQHLFREFVLERMHKDRPYEK